MLQRRRAFLRTSAAGISVLATGCVATEDDEDDGEDDDGGTAGGSSSGGSGSTGGGGSESGAVDESTGDPTGFDPEEVAESVELFPRAVFAGSMRTDAVILSGHTTDPGALRLIIWRDEDGAISIFLDDTVDTDEHGFVKVSVTELEAGLRYRYAFFVDDGEVPSARSIRGEFRTAPADDSTEPVTIAIGACIGNGTLIPDYVNPDEYAPKFWDALAELENHDFDVFVQLGDQGYMDNIFAAGADYEMYLDAWGAYHAGGYRTVTNRAGMLHTWDDHEVTDNASFEPWTEDAAQREMIDNAIRAYFTIMPIDAAEAGDRLWNSFRWGQTVEFIVLDCRHERLPPKEGQYIGQEQLDFLLDRLANSPCRFKAIVNSVPFATLAGLFGEDDRWEGHPAQRDEVRTFIDDNGIEGVVWLTGDLHQCYVGRTEADRGGMWEVAVTSGNIAAPSEVLPRGQFDWAVAVPHAPLLTFDADAGTVQVTFYTAEGDVGYEQTLTF